MNSTYPVFTLKNECQDCYKCVRECTTKAIKIENGHASIISDKCIACGHCVTICPQKAKTVRNDIEKVKILLDSNKDVYVSLAPSWVGSFNCSDKILICALKKMGFAGVSETSLGAQEVSAQVVNILNATKQKLHISTACPALVYYIRIYKPEFIKFLTPIASPALTHAKMLKNNYGDDSAVVFIGPCIAKKNESDKHPELIDAAITFKDLHSLFAANNISLENIKLNAKNVFVPQKAYEGNIYPIEGGMNKTIERHNLNEGVRLIDVSSIPSLNNYLKNLNTNDLRETIFIEALACEGGCINGPCMNTDKSGLAIVSDVISKTEFRKEIPATPVVVVQEKFQPKVFSSQSFSTREIIEAMKSIGKNSKEDELDCGGCGYNTCRQLAEALLANEAEPSMCVSYMRKIALQKASSMLRCMPSAVVMTDKYFKIVESNDAFTRMFASEMYEYYSSKPEGLAGAAIERLIPCVDIFAKALKTGKDIHCERYPINDKLYDITAFTIETNTIVGAIITDVTKTEMKREQIARKAQEVISKNISIVQNIACLLGEHMVETELLLGSIAEGYETGSENKQND